MAAFEVIALDTATPQLRAPGASDTYTFPRAVEMPLGTANGVLFLNGSKVVTSGSGLTFDGNTLSALSGGTTVIVSRAAAGNQAFVSAAGNAGTVGTSSFDMIQDGSGIAYLYQRANQPMLFGVNNSEQMRLTSTGLGIGTSSPGAKLEVAGSFTITADVSATTTIGRFGAGYPWSLVRPSSTATGIEFRDFPGNALYQLDQTSGNQKHIWYTGGTERMRLDASGNLGLGVTPSNWGGAAGFLEMPNGRALAFAGINGVVSTNGYYDTGWKYKTTGAAAKYDQAVGAHQWYTASSGTAGNAISFTQAMTLDASGNLGIGTSSPDTKLRVDAVSPTRGVVQTIRGTGGTGSQVNLSQDGVADWAFGQPAGVSAFAIWSGRSAGADGTERLRLKSTGQLRYIPLAADPAGAENGDVYYNSTTNKLRLYAAGAWVDLN